MFKLLALSLLLQLAVGDGFSLQPRIVNGIRSNPADFPFFVLLLVHYPNGQGQLCGSTLINDK